MRSEYLEYFLEAIKTGSFNKAAANLGITHQTISTSIKNLENEIDANVLIRDKSGVHLTAAGKIMIDYAHNILEQIYECKEAIRQATIADELTGHLDIYLSPYLNSYLMPTIYKLFSTKHPKVSLRFIEQEKIPIRAQINNNQGDIGIFLATPTEIDTYDLDKLVEDPYKLYIVGTPSHPLANRKSISIKTMLKYPIALYQTGNKFGALNEFIDQNIKIEKTFSPYLTTSNLDVYIQCIASGKAIGFLAKPKNHKNCFSIQESNDLFWCPIAGARDLSLCYMLAPGLSHKKQELSTLFLSEIRALI